MSIIKAVGEIIGIDILLLIFYRILFIIGLVILFISIISFIIIKTDKKPDKTKNKKLPLVLTIIGIIIGISLPLPHLRTYLLPKIKDSKTEEKEVINTGIIVYWQKNGKRLYLDEYFVYNNRTYVYFDGLYLSCTENNEPIANIKYEDKDIGGLIYSIKGCDDFSLLFVEHYGKFIYCDINLIYSKRQYFENADNYDLFISRRYKPFVNETGHEITNRSLSNNDYDNIKEFNFNKNDNYIEIPRKAKDEYVDYEYITIYGNSHDGVQKRREFKSFLIYNENIYKYEVRIEIYYGVNLNDKEKKYILSLL